MPSSLLNKSVSVECGGSFTSGQVCVAKNCVVPRQRAELCLQQLPVMKREVGAVEKMSIPEKKLSRDHHIFNGNPGNSQPGQTEAARRHFHGNMCLEYPHP